jgi:hypothetical protein
MTALRRAQHRRRSSLRRDRIRPSFEAHKGDFDYLLGEWEFTSVSKEHGPGKGFWTALRLATG